MNTMKFTNDVLQNCTFETYIILLTTLTPINLIKFKQNYNKFQVSWEEYKHKCFHPMSKQVKYLKKDQINHGANIERIQNAKAKIKIGLKHKQGKIIHLKKIKQKEKNRINFTTNVLCYRKT